MLKEDISQKIFQFIRPGEKVIALVGIFSEEHPNSNFVSQYKNLYARYKYRVLPNFISTVHTSITAIDRKSFWKVNGFDEASRVEDVDLGERIASERYRIYLDKSMEVVHLKKFTLKKMLANDFYKTRALADYFWRVKDKKRILREGFINDISLPMLVSMLSSSFIFPSLVLAIFFRPMFIIAALSFLIFIIANIGFLKYLANVKGKRFALFSLGLTFIDMNCVALASFITFLRMRKLHQTRCASIRTQEPSLGSSDR